MLCVLTLVLAAAVTAAASGPAQAAPPAPSSSSVSAARIDSHDPDLALPTGTTLAQPKILELDAALAGVEAVTSPYPAGPGADDRTRPTATPSTTSSGSAQPSSPPADTPSTPAPTLSSQPAQPSPAPAPAPGASDPASPAVLLGTTALLAAAVTGTLALLLRARRNRRRTARKQQPTPSHPLVSDRLRPNSSKGPLTRLDAALRTLAQTPTDAGGGSPSLSVAAARIGPDALHVLPAVAPARPPAPYTDGPDPWWTLPHTAPLPAVDDQNSAPCPALTVLGTTADGDTLLLNLTHQPALLLKGTAQDITDVVRALALELATSPWAHRADIVLTGLGDDLARVLPDIPLTCLPDPGDALRHLAEHLLHTHQNPHHPPRPCLWLTTTPLTPDIADRYTRLTRTPTTTPLALIAPAQHLTHLNQATSLNASAHDAQPVPALHTHLTLQRLTPAQYRNIITSLSPQPAPPKPQPSRADTEQSPEDPATSTSAHALSPAPGSPPPRPAHTTALSTHHAERAATPAASPSSDSGVFPALRDALPDSRRTSPTPQPGPLPAGSRSRRSATESRQHPTAPQIRVLGPVEIDGIARTGHGPRTAQLAALLYFKPGRTADTLCHDMDPHAPWNTSTLNARLHDLRRALGNAPDGTPYVPRRRTSDDPYHLSPYIACDWTHFTHLTQHTARSGPSDADALDDLDKALALVRGKPFGDTPPAWAEPYQQEMITAITDTAHTVAVHRTQPGPRHDLSAARSAVTLGLDIHPSAEKLYRAWMLVEHHAGNRSGLHTAITRLQHVNRQLDCPLEGATEDLIQQLLTGTPPPHAHTA